MKQMELKFAPPSMPMPAGFNDETNFSEPEEEILEEKKSNEPPVFTISQLNAGIRQILEGEFSQIWVKGEISNFKGHTSGHFYFALKDQKAQISAVMFKGHNARLKFRPADGMEVLVRGKITVYEPRGNYQIFCESMEPVGAGALQMAYEQLKSKLQAEGLFDVARKRPLPAIPQHLCLVTSPTGAAIRDMINVLGRRFKGLKITLVPAVVQGDAAPNSIINAMKMAWKLKDVDVMIVGRGGGSIEDLWAFNDERVVRAIAASPVPVISAVGHEIDFTIADFVADLRAPTPSAAAELVVKNAGDLINQITVQARNLKHSFAKYFQALKQKNSFLAKQLVDPQRRLQDLMIRCDELTQRLEQTLNFEIASQRQHIELLTHKMGTPQDLISERRKTIEMCAYKLGSLVEQKVESEKASFARMTALLDSLSPLKVVDRGYSIVTKDKKIIKRASDLASGDQINIRFAEGETSAQII